MSKKTFVKLGLVFAVAFGLWRLWENDAAANALILFCTAGIVPGTAVQLTPEQVYIVLGIILFIAIMIIFSKELVRDVRAVTRAWRHWRQKAIMASDEHQVIEDMAEVTPPVVTITATANQPQALPSTQQHPITHKPVVVIALPHEPSVLAKIWQATRPKLIIGVGAMLEILLKNADRTAVLASRASLQIWRYGMQAWLWVEPYLRRFDRWLERTLKSNKDVAAVLHMWSDFLKTTHAQFTEIRSRLARTPED